MGMVLDQNLSVTTGTHMQDCSFESCLSPSLGWLSPARISFSKDFSPHELEAVGGAVEAIGIKTNDNLSFKGKDSRSGKDSMSEFEFTMAALECDQNADNGKHMLAADELFFKGKLLPLYVPQFICEGAEQRGNGQHTYKGSDSDMNLMSSSSSLSSSLSSSSSLSCVPLNHGALASSKGKTKESAKMPLSPKTPKCSTKLRELFGLKKPKAVQGVMPATSNTSKASSKSTSKQRKTAMEAKSPLQTLGKAKRLFCRSDDGMSKVPEGRSSTSEPLLLDGCNGAVLDSMPSIGCPVISFLPHHQQLYNKKPQTTTSSHNPSPCTQITRMQRNNRVSDQVEDPSLKAGSMQQLRVLREMKNNENYVSARISASCRKVPIKEDLKPAIYRGTRRPSLQGFSHYGGSGESSPARRSSGAMSPAGSSGQWSPGRHSAGALMSGYNTTCSSCWGSPGRHSTSGATPCYSPGRLSVGIEPPTLSSLDLGHVKLMRARSLERSSSYSPKSLQRRYDQMKALRQRDGWRPAGLERSSSYNNMSSVRVAPVLNVPRVCSINRSSKSNTCSHTQNNSSGNSGGGFGLGHLLFSTRSQSSKALASSKLLQTPKQPPSSSRRRDFPH